MWGVILGMVGGIAAVLGAAIGLMPGQIMSPVQGILIVAGVLLGVSLYSLIYDFITAGIPGVFAKARLSGQSVGIVLRNDKRLKFVASKLKDGLAENKFGEFLVIPDSVYTTDNGATTWIGYHKYGVNLPVPFIRATTRLREMGVKDIGEVKAINNDATEHNEDVSVRLDARMEDYDQQMEEIRNGKQPQ